MTYARSTSLELLGALIAFDTTSRNSNLELIGFVEDYLARRGVDSIRVDHDEAGKTNLYATIGPDIDGGIVLSGHTDVVPVDGQPWSSDPFRMEVRDGRAYGRGACDMKGFIACALAAVDALVERDLRLPVHLAFSCDEEVGCTGVRNLIAHIDAHLPRPGLVIVGEPTSMQVVDAHKSAETYRTVVTGHEAHSSCIDLGVNAIMTAGELIGELGRIRDDFIARGDPSGRFDPPYSSVHVGLISGGTAKNIIPRECAFDWETRMLPGADRDEAPARLAAFAATLEPAMKRIAADAGVTTTRINAVPGLEPRPHETAHAVCLKLAEANETHAVSYCTEAGLFQNIGLPALICGPGSIAQAHRADEFVDVSQLAACDAFLGRVAAYAERPASSAGKR